MMNEAIYTEPFHPHLILHRVEGGAFMMGGADDEAYSFEKPVHKVTVTSFYLGKLPVTQSLWQAVMGSNPSYFKGDNHPVEQVSWLDVVNNFLPGLQEITGKSFRLPTEAEWEFAARGGTKSAGYVYSGSDKLKQVGWYHNNSGNETRPVDQKMANELGLLGMSGNVWEWCADNWHGNYISAPENGTAWLSDAAAANRILRGGSYFNESPSCRTAYRHSYRPDASNDGIGFRLALSPQ